MLLLAGLSRQSGTAVEHVAAQALPGARFIRVGDPGSRWTPADLDAAAARTALCIVDLLGLGWSRWSAERERDLDSLLGLKPALVLVPSGDGGGWLHVARERPSPRVVLQQPLAVTALREALRAAAAPANRGTVAAGPGRTDGRRALASPAHATAAVASLATTPAPAAAAAEAVLAAAAAPPSTPPSPPSHGRRGALQRPLACAVRGLTLEAGALGLLRAACPGLAGQGFLGLVLDIALAGEPTELRIASRSGAVFNPRAGWVASNIPTVLRDGLLRHDLMLQTVTTRRIAFDEAEPLAATYFGRRREGLRPISGFVWSLADAAFARAPPVLERDLVFQLHRFPDFARLRAVPEGFHRLAVVCLRGPQSVRALEREFPMLEPGLVARFALVALLSGQATLREEALPPAQQDNDAARAARPAKGGLLRALLAKLF